MKKILKILIIVILIWGLMKNFALVFYFDKKYPETAELEAVAQVVSMKTERRIQTVIL